MDGGPRRESRLRTEAGGRARSSAPRRRILAAQSHNSCLGEPFVRRSRVPLLVSGPGGSSGPPLSRTAGVAERPTTCTGLGAEFVTHLKVARNQVLPNPRAQAPSAGAMKPSEGRDEVRETKGRSLKAAMLPALWRWGHRSNSLPDLKG